MGIRFEEYSSEYKKFLAVFPFEASGISMSIDENGWKMKFLRPICFEKKKKIQLHSLFNLLNSI